MKTDPNYDFYRALYREIDGCLNLLLQIRRDYARETRGVHVRFAIDYSELHDYMELYSKRNDLNSFIIDNSLLVFTLLPSAVGELLHGLHQDITDGSSQDFVDALREYPAVTEFVRHYPKDVHDLESLISLYSPAESYLATAMGYLYSVALGSNVTAGTKKLLNLLDTGRIQPVEGIKDLGRVPLRMKQMESLVQFHLSISRPTKTKNNIADASDLIVARMLCEQKSGEASRYTPIYTQSAELINASIAHESLLFEDDPLVRSIKYFQYRTRLQMAFDKASKRSEKLDDMISTSKTAKLHIGEATRGPENKAFWRSKEGVEAGNAVVEFDEKVRRFLYYRTLSDQSKAKLEERARRLYKALKEQKEFTGKVDEACDVLREQLKEVQDKLQAFAPNDLDISDITRYKTHLRRWLGAHTKGTHKS